MTDKQGTLIYIEQENIKEAEFMSKSFVNNSVKNRAYINALGAELVLKYLATEGFDVSNLYHIHSISKCLEVIDISDIILPNIHIDARVIFDENQIFIPKSHFKLSITPDIYIVLKLEKDLSHAELLGFVEPKLINLKNQNSDYYFIEKSKLTTPDKLASYIRDFVGNTEKKLSQNDFAKAQELFISMSDHDISNSEQEELLSLMLKSSSLREKVLEFDNFETLSYNVGSLLNKSALTEDEQKNNVLLTLPSDENNLSNENSSDESETETETDGSEDNKAEVSDSSLETEIQSDSLGDDSVLLESFFDDLDTTELNEEDISLDLPLDGAEQTHEEKELEESQEKIQATDEENTVIDDASSLESINEVPEDIQEDKQEDVKYEETPLESEIVEDDTLNFDINGEDLLSDNVGEDFSLEEPLSEEEEVSEVNREELSNDKNVESGKPEENISNGEELLGQSDLDISSAEEEVLDDLTLDGVNLDDLSLDMEDESIADANVLENDLKEDNNNLEQDVNDVVNNSVDGNSTDENDEILNESSVSSVTNKLSGISGDIVNELINKNIESQQENLDKIDYSKSKIDATAVPSNISALDLSTAKIEANIEAEQSGQFDSPKDLSELKPVNQNVVGYGDEIEHETVDMKNMQSIELDEVKEHTDAIVDFHNISQVNSPTTPVDDLDDKLNSGIEHETMDLPGMGTFTINSDGSSSLDNLDINLNLNSDEEHLMDLDMDISDIMMNSEITDDSTHELTSLEQINSTPNSVKDTDNNEEVEDDKSDDVLNDFGAQEDSQQNSQQNEELLSEDVFDFGDESDFLDDINIDDLETPMNIDEEVSANEHEEIKEDEISDTEVLADIENSQNEEIIEEEQLQNQFEGDDKVEVLEDGDLLLQDEVSHEEQPQTSQEEDFIGEEVLQDESEEDWLNDENLDNFDSVENLSNEELDKSPEVQEGEEVPEEELNEEDIIEPVEEEKVFSVSENSVVITDKNFNVGEIKIDINQSIENSNIEGDEQLEELYDESSAVPGEAFLQSSGRIGSVESSTNNRKSFGLGLGIIGLLLVLVIVGIIGFSVSKIVKNSQNSDTQPLEDTISNTNNVVNDVNTLNIDPSNVVNMKNNSMPIATTNKTPKPIPSETVTATPSVKPAVKSIKRIPNTAFIEVKKLSWEVPDYISYDANFRQYFQSAGKSLKLSLTSDLLLATDYSYSNRMKVSVLYDKSGAFTEAKILQSSGSAQIDNIVLQTVNQTLKVLKAPHSVGNDESTTVILKIYF